MIAAARARPVTFLGAMALVAVFAVRAVVGLTGGIAYFKAVPLIENGEYERALAFLRWAAVGPDREDALLLRAEVQRGLWWSAGRKEDVPPDERRRLIEGAATDLLEAGWSIPAAGWPWAGLADLYDRLERERRGLDADLRIAEDGSWDELGRAGAVGIGLVRRAIERHPSDFVPWDRLAMMLLRYGMQEEGLEAVRRAAAAHPTYRNHPFPWASPESPAVVAAFARGARESLGSAPMIDIRSHLLEIAKLEMRMDQPRAAEDTLRRALEQPGRTVSSAYVRYWLGRALLAQDRDAEAEQELIAAAEAPEFGVASLVDRAGIARRAGDPERALRLLREARWGDPTRLDICLEFAEVAREVDRLAEALQAVEWAGLMHPEDPRPSLERVRILQQRGRIAEAFQALAQHKRRFGEGAQTEALEASLRRADRGPRSSGESG